MNLWSWEHVDFFQSLKQMLWLHILFNRGICCGAFAVFSIWLTAPVCLSQPCCLLSQSLSATTHSATYCQAWHRCSVSFWELQERMDHQICSFLGEKQYYPFSPCPGRVWSPFVKQFFLYFRILYWFLKASTSNCHLVAEHHLMFSYLPVFAFN